MNPNAALYDVLDSLNDGGGAGLFGTILKYAESPIR